MYIKVVNLTKNDINIIPGTILKTKEPFYCNTNLVSIEMQKRMNSLINVGSIKTFYISDDAYNTLFNFPTKVVSQEVEIEKTEVEPEKVEEEKPKTRKKGK